MTLCTTGIAVDRIKHSNSRIAVFRNHGPSKKLKPLDAVFADTIETQKILEADQQDLVAIFAGKSNPDSALLLISLALKDSKDIN